MSLKQIARLKLFKGGYRGGRIISYNGAIDKNNGLIMGYNGAMDNNKGSVIKKDNY